ncbi:MAG: hypothetical protein DHS20C21_16950 [Gemmatimonadota bacterium]|nr:MAG: hypothetical protein DHS20C21_16950 [Gemmatimonadota bacterium]
MAGLRTGWRLAAGVLALMAGVVGCQGTSPEADSAVLITIDTWRSDSFGAGGHPELRTPHLDRFFRGGVQFSQAFSPIPTTLASHASLLTGAWPTEHGVPRNVWTVPGDLVTLPEALHDHGFTSAAFISSAVLERGTNIGQGFDEFDDAIAEDASADSWRPASETLPRARRWWNETGGRRFLWVHLFEPHLPYRPTPEWAAVYDTGSGMEPTASVERLRSMWLDKDQFTSPVREHLVSLYQAEISGLDRQLGGFLRDLAREDRVAVVVAADHGESLGEHNLFFKHGPKVFPADTQIPLLLRSAAVGRGVSSSLVRTIDVPGAILSLLDVPADLPPDADNLRDWTTSRGGLTVFGIASAPHDAPPEILQEDGYANARMPRVIRRGDQAFLETPWQNRRVWFDRATDPGERSARRVDDAAAIPEMRAELDAWISEARVTESALQLDPALEERMRALGYLN